MNRKCTGCQAITTSSTCACGNEAIPFVDNRPLLLAPVFYHAITVALDSAYRELASCFDQKRITAIEGSILHYEKLLDSHDKAINRGPGGYRTLDGLSEQEQVCPLHSPENDRIIEIFY